MNKEKKQNIITSFQHDSQDTGSTAVQVALITQRILDLTKHLETNAKDFSCKKSLLVLVGKRRKYLGYLKRTNHALYESVIQKLSLKSL